MRSSLWSTRPSPIAKRAFDNDPKRVALRHSQYTDLFRLFLAGVIALFRPESSMTPSVPPDILPC
jgi:hypothetical protein